METVNDYDVSILLLTNEEINIIRVLGKVLFNHTRLTCNTQPQSYKSKKGCPNKEPRFITKN